MSFCKIYLYICIYIEYRDDLWTSFSCKDIYFWLFISFRKLSKIDLPTYLKYSPTYPIKWNLPRKVLFWADVQCKWYILNYNCTKYLNYMYKNNILIWTCICCKCSYIKFVDKYVFFLDWKLLVMLHISCKVYCKLLQLPNVKRKTETRLWKAAGVWDFYLSIHAKPGRGCRQLLIQPDTKGDLIALHVRIF